MRIRPGVDDNVAKVERKTQCSQHPECDATFNARSGGGQQIAVQGLFSRSGL